MNTNTSPLLFPPPSQPLPANSRPNPIPTTACPPSETILFYDGTCGFCSRIVQFILKHEKSRKSLRFATLQGPTAASLRQAHPFLANTDSVVWYQPTTATKAQRLLVRSDAGLAAAAYLGGAWRFLAALARCVPRPIRDASYNAVARNRHRLVRDNACRLPSPAQQARFID